MRLQDKIIIKFIYIYENLSSKCSSTLPFYVFSSGTTLILSTRTKHSFTILSCIAQMCVLNAVRFYRYKYLNYSIIRTVQAKRARDLLQSMHNNKKKCTKIILLNYYFKQVQIISYYLQHCVNLIAVRVCVESSWAGTALSQS